MAALKNAVVLSSYTDKHTGEVHWAGESVELSDARAKELAESGHVRVKQPKRKATARKAAETEQGA